MAQTSILIQLDESVQARLAALAQLRQMPVSDVAADVITTFLSPESWESQRIQAGMLELEEGKGIPNERVMDWLDSWGSANELPAPR